MKRNSRLRRPPIVAPQQHTAVWWDTRFVGPCRNGPWLGLSIFFSLFPPGRATIPSRNGPTGAVIVQQAVREPLITFSSSRLKFFLFTTISNQVPSVSLLCGSFSLLPTISKQPNILFHAPTHLEGSDLFRTFTGIKRRILGSLRTDTSAKPVRSTEAVARPVAQSEARLVGDDPPKVRWDWPAWAATGTRRERSLWQRSPMSSSLLCNSFCVQVFYLSRRGQEEKMADGFVA